MVSLSNQELTDELEDLKDELGPSPEGVYASVRVRLDILESRINNPAAPGPNVENPFIIGNGGVTFSTGVGEPTEERIPGSLYLRQDGYAAQALYTWREDNQWHVVVGIASDIPNASTTIKGLVKLAGDLGGTADLPTVIDLTISGETQGDILYRNATSWTRLPAGTSGQVLQTLGTGANPAWVTISATPTGSAGGDLSGSYPNPTVAKINGTSVPATPSANQVLIASSGTSSTWAQIADTNISSSAAITGSKISNATAGATGVIQLAGDISGTATSVIVSKINGATVPTAGALTTGHVLQVSGVSATVYGFIANANVSSSAAIDGSKISPNFVAQSIIGQSLDVSSGTLSLGTSTASSISIGKIGATTTINGNLTINGTTTTVNSTVVDIADRIVHVNNSTGTVPVPSNICGWSVHRGNTGSVDRDHAGVFWDETVSSFKFAFNTTGDDTTVGASLPIIASGATLNGLSTGIVHSSSLGVLSSSLIINTDVSGSAAIDGYKITSATTGARGVIQLAGNLGGTAISPTVTGLTIPSEARGDLIYRGASAWVRLPAGTSGQLLKTQGSGADPVWTNSPTAVGTYAARPAAGTAGRVYYGTDTSSVVVDDGYAWRPILPPGCLGTEPALSTNWTLRQTGSNFSKADSNGALTFTGTARVAANAEDVGLIDVPLGSTTTNASYVQPTGVNTVQVTFTATGANSGLAVGKHLFINGGGSYIVDSIDSSTLATIHLDTGATGNTASGNTITTGKVVIAGAYTVTLGCVFLPTLLPSPSTGVFWIFGLALYEVASGKFLAESVVHQEGDGSLNTLCRLDVRAYTALTTFISDLNISHDASIFFHNGSPVRFRVINNGLNTATSRTWQYSADGQNWKNFAQQPAVGTNSLDTGTSFTVGPDRVGIKFNAYGGSAGVVTVLDFSITYQ